MKSSARDYCLRAVAHLKLVLPEDGTPAMELDPGDSPVIHLLGHGLLVVYLVDAGNHFKYVQNRHLTEAGLSASEFHAQAIQNLVAFAEKNVEVRQHGSMYAVLAGGNFEASMLLVDKFWSEWYGALAPNGFVVAFPARDLLAFGDATSNQAIAELRSLCEGASGTVDHPLSSELYRRSAGVWEPLSG